jgi:hypothetical protein
MTDSDQYDVIMFLLAKGADSNQGQVLRWVVQQFYHDKCSESEFVELFFRIVNDHGAHVNYQENGIGPCILEAIHDYFYDGNGSIRRNLSYSKSWLDKVTLTINTFLENNGDINIQHIHTQKTLLCKIGDVPQCSR